jgi:acyl-coenzyme A thioesterase PaaI-like protein
MLGENFLEKLIARDDKFAMMALSNAFKFAIPFNAPHGFKLKKYTKEEVQIEVPNKKLNHNHLGGIHACAMATVGEFCAGSQLLKNFGTKQYRYILQKLEVDYHYQGRKNIIGTAKISPETIQNIIETLKTQEKIVVPCITEIYDTDQKHIATVRTFWQMKDWKSVKTK